MYCTTMIYIIVVVSLNFLFREIKQISCIRRCTHWRSWGNFVFSGSKI